MTTKIDVAEAEASFINGSPRHQYDEIFRCFKGDNNGLLFRCVDTSDAKNQRWYFYNDTTDTVMKVRTVFSAESVVRGVRAAKQTTQENPETGKTETVVEVEVGPCRTEAFIEGVPNGFEMEFQTEAAPAEDVAFEHGQPAVAYDKIYKCFKNNGNGLFFRLVDDQKQTWYFYNDTTDYSMVATVEFTDAGAVQPLGNAEEVGTPAGNPDGIILRIAVPPLTTEPFIMGEPVNYKMSFSADPVSNDLPEDPADIQYNGPGPNHRTVDADGSKIYKCFKKNDNGLLFRYVDERRKEWAYYNDTEVYLMKATVRIPQSEDFTPSNDAVATEDPEDPSIIVVEMEIPPHETMKFLDGNPKNFETSYSAVSVNAPKPEESPKYANGEPDRNIMDYDQVTKAVKQQDSDDAVLYRLFDSRRKKWGFYNDSNDITVVARVRFNDGARIRKFALTKVDSDESGESDGIYYVIEVRPHETVEFVEGEYTSFESKFTGTRKANSASE